MKKYIVFSAILLPWIILVLIGINFAKKEEIVLGRNIANNFQEIGTVFLDIPYISVAKNGKTSIWRDLFGKMFVIVRDKEIILSFDKVGDKLGFSVFHNGSERILFYPDDPEIPLIFKYKDESNVQWRAFDYTWEGVVSRRVSGQDSEINDGVKWICEPPKVSGKDN